jgi:hypothetical protein
MRWLRKREKLWHDAGPMGRRAWADDWTVVASFRLIVSGEVGVKEMELLIRKLELDKEILAAPEDDGKATN